MRFTNLLTELARKNISKKELAEKISMRPETLYKKIRGGSDFTYPEILRIRDEIDPDLKLDYLFKIEEA